MERGNGINKTGINKKVKHVCYLGEVSSGCIEGSRDVDKCTDVMGQAYALSKGKKIPDSVKTLFADKTKQFLDAHKHKLKIFPAPSKPVSGNNAWPFKFCQMICR